MSASDKNNNPGKATHAHGTLWIAFAMLLLITIFYLLREHWEHALGLWPYLILLVCPLLHLFHGHGKHEH